MAYDLQLAERIRAALGRSPGLSEKKMFGGLCFLVHGNMCCGVLKSELVLRAGLDVYERLLAQEKSLRPMDFTGRPLRGFLYVAPDGLRRSAQLRRWVGISLQFARSLPRKRAKAKAR